MQQGQEYNCMPVQYNPTLKNNTRLYMFIYFMKNMYVPIIQHWQLILVTETCNKHLLMLKCALLKYTIRCNNLLLNTGLQQLATVKKHIYMKG